MPTCLTTALLAKILKLAGWTNKVALQEILFFVYEAGKRVIKMVVHTFYPVFFLDPAVQVFDRLQLSLPPCLLRELYFNTHFPAHATS